jgi:hypothetical protein
VQYKKYGNDMAGVVARALEVANLVHALFAPLNIHVTLVDTVVWDRGDAITVSWDSLATLNAFLAYRRSVLLPRTPHNNAVLIT